MKYMQPVRSAAKRLAVKMNLIRRPSFLIVGAQKAGTTALHRMLVSARGVRGAKRKELHYFDDGFIRYGDVDAYHQCFPHVASIGAATRTFEASPEYLCHPLAAERIFRYQPKMKIVAILRDPIERAYSGWNMYHNKFPTLNESWAPPLVDPRSFEQAIAEELESPVALDWLTNARGYLLRGLYAEQLIRFYQCFPRDQVLVLFQEDLELRPHAVTTALADFLRLSRDDLGGSVRSNVSDYRGGGMSSAVREQLVAFFRPHNQALRVLLGRELPPSFIC